MNKIFAIYDTQENTFLSFRSKVAWATIAAAKNAFGLHMPRLYNEAVGYCQQRFDDQTRYEIVELSEVFYRMKQLEK